jgi:type IV secretory pathway component VirB8
VILDTEGNIFGGFTPGEWKSPVKWDYKADDSLKSSLFTLKNPHNVPAKRFALKAEMKHQAIVYHSKWVPYFGYPYDIGVSATCNTNTCNFTVLSWSYTNDTRLHREVVFTGSQNFQVKEIEVFEITG